MNLPMYLFYGFLQQARETAVVNQVEKFVWLAFSAQHISKCPFMMAFAP